jgi:UDP-N-acetylglucosamine 2-epimerase (non-hydrolysing)/GDP/UDP-N,N'-diacetylbacillosamine 2-epimerase (hydrolysing)
VRTIGVVTVARSDYGIYLPLLRQIQADPDLKLYLIVAGMHLSPEFGLTAKAIEADGFEINERVEMLLSSDTPEGIVKAMGLGNIGFAQTLARFRPDIIVVLGDRFEMHAAALAALPFKIPVAHIHGGEITQGAIDDALRHSITKLSHLHFVSTQEYAQRVIQMGEEPWRVTISGALSLDNLHTVRLLTCKELSARFGLHVNEIPFLLVTFHPVTLEYEQTERQMAELLTALAAYDLPLVFTMPNADTSGRIITRMIEEFVATHSSAQAVDNLGTQGYFSMMALAAAMVGNSSSGILEAASFELPVVNIGNRQRGRVRGDNVIDVGYKHDSILEGLHRALDSQFRTKLRGIRNPYDFGGASNKIVEVLKRVQLDDRLVVKHFHDLEAVSSVGLRTV